MNYYWIKCDQFGKDSRVVFPFCLIVVLTCRNCKAMNVGCQPVSRTVSRMLKRIIVIVSGLFINRESDKWSDQISLGYMHIFVKFSTQVG